MTSFTNYLSGIVGKAFKQLELPFELGQVRVSDRPDLAHFQCNGAMAAAKIAKKNPRDIASDIKKILDENENFSKVEIAGPGFINLSLNDDALATHL